MSTSTHTPGPWTAKPTASLGPQYLVYPEASGPDIAIVYDHGNTEANARLIAAAPALLSNLQYIELVAPTDNPEDTDYVSITITGKALKDIRAAIAQAEGEV